MAISMLKVRRPLGRLIFNMGIAIPGKTVSLIGTAPWLPSNDYDCHKLCSINGKEITLKYIPYVIDVYQNL